MQAYFITRTHTYTRIDIKLNALFVNSVFFLFLLSNDVQSLLLVAWKSDKFYNP